MYLHEQKRAVMALNSSVCTGMKGTQQKNAAIAHGVNAEAKVLADITGRWVHEYQVLAAPGGWCSCISCRKKDERVLVEGPASAYAQSKAQKRVEFFTYVNVYPSKFTSNFTKE